jgi:hypothetical protein
MRYHALQVLIALDQLVNALLGGWADETLSSRAWRMERKGRPWGRVLRPVIDTLAWPFERDHCRASFDSEREGRQLPPEFRTTLRKP